MRFDYRNVLLLKRFHFVVLLLVVTVFCTGWVFAVIKTDNPSKQNNVLSWKRYHSGFNNEHHAVSFMGRGLLHVAEAGLCLNFTEQIHLSSEPLSIIPDVKPNYWLHVTRNLFTVFGLITIDHACVVWGWICCVGDGCVWDTKWSNNHFNWCYGWESMWDTVQVSVRVFLDTYNYEELS